MKVEVGNTVRINFNCHEANESSFIASDDQNQHILIIDKDLLAGSQQNRITVNEILQEATLTLL